MTGAFSLILRGIADELSGASFAAPLASTCPTDGPHHRAEQVSPELGGVTTDISVMFMDVRGFNPVESLSASPQILTRLINIILDEASDVIMAHEGTLDKFISDCVMAF